jgi:hypothetical protein
MAQKNTGKDSSLRSVVHPVPQSFPRKRKSSTSSGWTPACAGVTVAMFIDFGEPKADATLSMTCEAEERRGAIARPAILQRRAVLGGRACHLEFVLVFGTTKQRRV